MKKDTYRKTSSEAFFKEYYGWKAAKEIHREKSLRLRKDAHKEFYVEHKGWFKTLDTIGIVLIALNFIALIITGLVVVKATLRNTTQPYAGFTTADEWTVLSAEEDIGVTIVVTSFANAALGEYSLTFANGTPVVPIGDVLIQASKVSTTMTYLSQPLTVAHYSA